MNSTNNSFETEKETLKEMTLAQIATKNYKSAEVFEKYDLDFCCNGNKSLVQACSEKGIDPDEIYGELLNSENSEVNKDMRFDDWELDFLVDYIVNNHHRYVRQSIPVIAAHAEKVVAKHGKNHPELIEIAKIFSTVYKDLGQHLIKEEELLFPYIKTLVKVKNNIMKYEAPFFGKIANPIKMMEIEHETAGNWLFDIRQLSENYSLPQDACNTYTVYYKELKEFEEDLHKHVYLENNILFPKSIILENKLIEENSNKIL